MLKIYITSTSEDKIEDAVDEIDSEDQQPTESSLENILEQMNKVNTFYNEYSSSSDPFEAAQKLFTSICTGKLIPELIGIASGIGKTDRAKNLMDAMIRFNLTLMERSFIPKNKVKTKDITTSFKALIATIMDYSDKSSAASNKAFFFIKKTMSIYLKMQSARFGRAEYTEKDLAALLIEILNPQIEDDEQKKFVQSLVTVALGVNLLPTTDQKLKAKLDIDKRVELFFERVFPTIFPGLGGYLSKEDIDQIYNIIVKLNTSFIQNIKDPKKLKYIQKDIINMLSHFGICSRTISNSLINVLDGNFEGSKILIQFLAPNIRPEDTDSMIRYLAEAKAILNFGFVDDIPKMFDKNSASRKTKADNEKWESIMKKIQDGTASSKDLFIMLDREGDMNGYISESEFQTLAARLGLKLSDHRVKEIFAKVKVNKPKNTTQYELNEKEFEQALEYLQSKNLQQALQLLGITPEILTAIFIRLILLLILIFIFIFMGIKAFAIGGTFGAIINSLFPAGTILFIILSNILFKAGGIWLGKKKDDDKEQLNEKNVEEAADTGFDIVVSEQM